MLNVHLRFTDANTQEPLPVRLRIFRPDGGTFTPLGRLPIFPCGRGEEVGGHVRVGRENFAYIDGGCEVPLPAGVPLRIQASHGPEYLPLDREVTLKPGQMALRLEMERWVDSRWDSWIRLDSRAHFLSAPAAALEGAAEGLDHVQLLAHTASLAAQDGNTYPTLPNLTAFSGQQPALAAHGCRVAVNTLNVHPSLGKLALLHCHRPVYPLAFGGSDGPDDWNLGDWADQCHRKGGLVIWVDAFRPEAGLLGGEALAALILGKIDAVEFDTQPRSQPFLPWYYRLLNAGLRVPLVGGSGKDSNRTALGSMRTYALATPEEPTWIEAVRAGRTFISNGPLLELTVVDGVASAVAESLFPFEKFEILLNGEVIASSREIGRAVPSQADASAPGECVGLDGGPLHRGNTVSALSWRPRVCPYLPRLLKSRWVTPQRSAAIAALAGCLDALTEWIETQGRYESPRGRERHRQLAQTARTRLGELGNRVIPANS